MVKSSVTAANWKCTTKLPSQHFYCTAFGYLSAYAGWDRQPIIVLQLQLAWPDLLLSTLGDSRKLPSRIFTSQARANRLVLRLLYVFRVCLSVCLCVRTYHVRNITACITIQLQSTTVLTAFGGLLAKIRHASVDLCCLDDKKVVGSRENPVFAIYSC